MINPKIITIQIALITYTLTAATIESIKNKHNTKQTIKKYIGALTLNTTILIILIILIQTQ